MEPKRIQIYQPSVNYIDVMKVSPSEKENFRLAGSPDTSCVESTLKKMPNRFMYDDRILQEVDF
jgi:hypothetical protein